MLRKLTLIVAIVALLLPAAALAQSWGSIDPAADAAGTDCNLPTSGLMTIHLIARPDLSVGVGAGFFAVEFDVDTSQLGAAGASFIGQNSLGTTTNGNLEPGPGIQIGFTTCQLSDTEVANITYFWAVAAVGTYYVTVTPSDLATEALAMAECTDLRIPQSVLPGQAVVSTEGVTCAVGTQDTTWGKLKALYSH
jgi:hypothetical protein